MLFDKDHGHKIFMDDVYETESRLPGGDWSPASIPWTDIVRFRVIVYSTSHWQKLKTRSF